MVSFWKLLSFGDACGGQHAPLTFHTHLPHSGWAVLSCPAPIFLACPVSGVITSPLVTVPTSITSHTCPEGQLGSHTPTSLARKRSSFGFAWAAGCHLSPGFSWPLGRTQSTDRSLGGYFQFFFFRGDSESAAGYL